MMLVVTTQMLTLVMVRMGAHQRRLIALETASSVLEIIVSQPYASIDESSLQLPAVQDLIDQNLADWNVQLRVETQDELIVAKRIDLRLIRASKPETRPMVFTTWKHQR